MSPPVSATARHERRYIREASRRRRRGGNGRGPVAVQRAASWTVEAAYRTVDVARRVIEGDRPLIAGLAALLALSVVMLSGPLQSFWHARERVALLEAKHGALTTEISALEDRAEALRDPKKIELLAREQQGFIRPGEVPYAIVPPEVERPQITAPREVEPDPLPWYRRAWETVAAWLG